MSLTSSSDKFKCRISVIDFLLEQDLFWVVALPVSLWFRRFSKVNILLLLGCQVIRLSFLRLLLMSDTFDEILADIIREHPSLQQLVL